MGSNSINIVNESAEFLEDEPSFHDFLSDNNILLGEPYYIVAIMGGQSGGKSTLLNALFGTSLAVLPQGERHATTKGIELALSTTSANKTFVLDLEGSDSTEKNESAGETFARKSSLFALAVSEVLIINVWAHDIGKRSATSLPVLECIFEAIFRIDRTSQARTTLLFVLRDYNAILDGPLPVLRQMINADLIDLWNSLIKPSRFAQATFEHLFAVTVHTLPHILYEPDAFEKAVTNLQTRFGPFGDLVNASDGWDKMRSVEFGAMYGYLRALWGCVSAMRELDIASQKELMTAQICLNAYEECCAEFSANAIVFSGTYDEWGAFGQAGEALFGATLTMFCKKAFHNGGNGDDSNCDMNANEPDEEKNVSGIKAIQTKWRLKLKEYMTKELKMTQNNGKNFYEHNSLEEHKTKLISSLASTDNVIDNLAWIVREERQCILKALEENLKKLDLSFCPITIYGDCEIRSEDEFSTGLEKNEREFVDKVQGVLSRLILKIAEEALYSFESIYKAGGKCVWDTLSQHSKPVVDCVTNRAYSFAKNAGKSSVWLETFQNRVFAQIEKKADGAFARLALQLGNMLNDEFDTLFKIEPKGLLRPWGYLIDCKPIWLSAKMECLERLEIYASKPKPLFDIGSTISPTPLVEAKALWHMRESFENYTLACLRKTETVSKLLPWAGALYMLVLMVTSKQ